MEKEIDEKLDFLGSVSGGFKYHNVCLECGKEWDSPEVIGDSMPNWYTGPWCPECRKRMICNQKVNDS